MKQICVIGLGYIGLPTAAMFATHGHRVLGVDVNPRVVRALNEGKIVIAEPNLERLVQTAVKSGNLSGKTTPEEADVFIIAVPTPLTAAKTADMSCVIAAGEQITPYLRKGNIVILESTSPTGTIQHLLLPILQKAGLKIGKELFVAHCPERVLPGKILIELVENSRIVGGINRRSAELVKKLYATFVRGEIALTDATTAEMCKMMENTYRDVNIALANELAKICERIGINAWEVIQLCNKHPRVNLHQPGPGVGGHCLAVDPWFIVEKAPDLAKLITLARETNDSMPEYVALRITDLVQHLPIAPKVTIMGATYKPDIDDTRESPILELLTLLGQKGYQVALVDPYITRQRFLEKDLLKAAAQSDLLVLAVQHQVFKNIDFEAVRQVMRNRLILDTRNFWDREKLQRLGFDYHLLGNNRDSPPRAV
jgi:UDP-N-acetyl-D-mannosaminuronic acid dehydrogenase